MKIRHLFRRRTATPAQRPVPAWEQDGHFQVGELVHMPPDRFREQVVWVKGDRVGVLTNPVLDIRANASRSQIRHLQGCEPCMADAAAQAAAEEERESAYWDNWPADHRELHDTVMEDLVLTDAGPHYRYRFGDRSPVREWMRTELDGHLVDDESPSLSLGRIWDPLDWPRIEDEHSGDGLSIDNPWKSVPWATIRAAFEILRDAECQPALDVTVDMDPLDDGTIGAEIIVSELFVDRPIEDGTYEQVAALLGDATEYPYSQIHYPMNSDGPGLDRTQPYTRNQYGATRWNWSGGDWMAPFAPTTGALETPSS